MKRALLIAGGALGGLGAVMAITPPQFSSTESLALGGGAMSGSTPTAVATSTDQLQCSADGRSVSSAQSSGRAVPGYLV